MKIKVSSLLLFVVLLYGVNYFLFERVLFFNELISLLGFIVFVLHSFRGNRKFWLPQSLIYKAVLLFLTLGMAHAILGLFIKTNWYYYFRTLSIVYSVFAFFLGFHLYDQQFAFYGKARKWVYGYGLLAFATARVGLLDRNSFSFWLALVQRNWRLLSVVFLFVLMGLYLLAYTSLTVFFTGAAILLFLSLRRYASFAFLAFLGILAFTVLFVQASPYLSMYSANKDLLFGDAAHVYAQHPWFNLDQNSSWRLIFWYRLVVEAFPATLVGLGLGTPLLPYHAGVTTTDLGYPDEHIAHVIGVHNSFITLYARLGLLAIVLLAMIYHRALKEFFRYKSYYLTNRNDGGIFLGFVAITVVAMFNLVMESPTLASLYWFSTGLVARAIYARKFESHGV